MFKNSMNNSNILSVHHKPDKRRSPLIKYTMKKEKI